MQTYDLCVAWNWEYDADFVSLLDSGCQVKGLSLLQITPGNLPHTLNALAGGELSCRVFFDRASDEDPQFMPLIQWMGEDSIQCINTYERASHTWDKAEMHALLVSEGIDVPPTIILPPYIDNADIEPVDLPSLGEQFTIKPAHGSGGRGVITNATSWDQVLNNRKEHATDFYLLQAHVIPAELDQRPAWFRVIYCAGKVFPCWWNPSNHVYTPVSDTDLQQHELHQLEQIVTDIASLCGLDLFSTEIAYTAEKQFVVVDYVNDQIDLRLQSRTSEGVPDAVVQGVVEELARLVEQQCKVNQ